MTCEVVIFSCRLRHEFYRSGTVKKLTFLTHFGIYSEYQFKKNSGIMLITHCDTSGVVGVSVGYFKASYSLFPAVLVFSEVL